MKTTVVIPIVSFFVGAIIGLVAYDKIRKLDPLEKVKEVLKL